MFSIAVGAASLALLVFALVDVIRSYSFKNLDKLTWVFIVVLLPLVGSILWFVLGKVYEERPSARFIAPERPEPAPMTPEEEQAAIEREIAFHENEARIRRLEADLRAKRERGDTA
jgi:hypothetical protein